MTEITFKLDIPQGTDPRILHILEKLVGNIIEEMEFSIAREFLKESELTEEHAKKLGREVNSAVAKRHL